MHIGFLDQDHFQLMQDSSGLEVDAFEKDRACRKWRVLMLCGALVRQVTTGSAPAANHSEQTRTQAKRKDEAGPSQTRSSQRLHG